MTTTEATHHAVTIETVGAVVRGPYGHLCRITEVLDHSRLSDRHLTSPGDVVVRTEPVGPGYGHASAWASTLTPAQPGDVGAHPHWDERYFPDRACPCGRPYTAPQGHVHWQAMPASWT